MIRSRPKWETTLLSEFPATVLFDQNCVQEIIKSEDDVVLSLRFFNWICSQDGFTPDASSYNTIFRILPQVKASKSATSLLSSAKFIPEPAFLEFFNQCVREGGSVEEAVEIFSKLRKLGGMSPSIEVWNTVLSGCLGVDRTDLVLKLYNEMKASDLEGNEDTVGYLIRAYCKNNKLSKADEVLHQFLERRIVPDVTAFTKLISGLSSKGKFHRVCELLRRMIAADRLPTMFTYQEIIHGLCKNKMLREAFRIFEELKVRGYSPNGMMYDMLIYGLCKNDDLSGFVPNEYRYNVLIHGYFGIGKLREALTLYKKMCDGGLKVSALSYRTLIRGMSLNGRMCEAIALFDEMLIKGLKPDVIIYNVIIQGFCEDGKSSKAMDIYKELLRVGLQPSTYTYTPLIRALCEEGNVVEAIRMQNEMLNRNLKPWVCTHDYIITGLCKNGNVTESMDRWAKMLGNKMKPQEETFNELIKCLTLNDRLEDAVLVLTSVSTSGYTLREHTYELLKSKFAKSDSFQAVECLERFFGSN
ncbi:hypothetical protein MKW92_000879 [Papaver armeniacum]|nr:hypothetical protein MKW92_000879 [Papaver armeniacum]